jgi:magnesium chelatase subunit I
MSEDEGHEDKLIHRIIDEGVKNIFGLRLDVRELRPIVDYFESGHSVEVGDTLSTRAMLERIAKVPGLRKRAEEFAAESIPNLTDRDARDAATASAAEFILEGLHVHNKLNKSAKAGGATYRR